MEDVEMLYRAVGNRCAVNLSALRLPVAADEVMNILTAKGFKEIKVDPVALAKDCVGRSHYRRGAKPSEAPATVDCSSFTKWLYGQCGIWLPRRSIQQREAGASIHLNDIIVGDLVFASGWIDYYFDDPSDGVGHVGICSGPGTVIHAANRKDGVVKSSLEQFTGTDKFRGARRLVPTGSNVITLETPPGREVEIDDDLRWIILQTIGKR